MLVLHSHVLDKRGSYSTSKGCRIGLARACSSRGGEQGRCIQGVRGGRAPPGVGRHCSSQAWPTPGAQVLTSLSGGAEATEVPVVLTRFLVLSGTLTLIQKLWAHDTDGDCLQEQTGKESGCPVPEEGPCLAWPPVPQVTVARPPIRCKRWSHLSPLSRPRGRDTDLAGLL